MSWGQVVSRGDAWQLLVNEAVTRAIAALVQYGVYATPTSPRRKQDACGTGGLTGGNGRDLLQRRLARCEDRQCPGEVDSDEGSEDALVRADPVEIESGD